MNICKLKYCMFVMLTVFQGSTTMSLQQINRQIYMNHCIYDPLPTAGQIVNSKYVMYYVGY